MALQFKSDLDKLWVEFFKAALSGRAANSEWGAKEDVANAAAYMADQAMAKIEEHLVPPGTPEPLFAPMLAKRKQDEDDSHFEVSR